MTMSALNDASVQISLGELNKNITKVGKALSIVASGQKINRAADDAASFAISEIMRVKLRALEQDIQNVQNGSALLMTAQAAIQNQIDMMKTIKAKVIDAANDSNSDEDRRIIQKEINQLYDQLDQEAYYTDYNTKKVLLGDTFKETTNAWVKLSAPIELPGSNSMDVIPNIDEMLDEIEGPFDIFTEFHTEPTEFINILEGEHEVSLSDGANGKPRIVDVDFSGYGSVDDLVNVGIKIEGMDEGDSTTSRSYVFTDNTSNNYRGSPTKIDISDCGSVEDVIRKLSQQINRNMGSYASAETVGSALRLTSGNKTLTANTYNRNQGRPYASGISGDAGSDPTTNYNYKSGTPAGVPAGSFSGGVNQIGDPNDPDPDRRYEPPKTATYGSVNISGAEVPSGFTVSYNGSSIAIEFTDSADPPQWDSARGVYTVGKNATVSEFPISLRDSRTFKLSLSNGTMNLSAGTSGVWGNSIIVSNSYTYVDSTEPGGTIDYTAYSPFKGGITLVQPATEDTKASYTIDVSEYSDVETLIDELAGKAIRYNRSGIYYEFIDSADTYSINSDSKSDNGTSHRTIDLNDIRKDVSEGMSIAESFANRFLAVANSYYRSRVPEEGEPVTGVKVTSKQNGELGNSETLSVWQDTLRHYDIDYGAWFEAHPDFNIPADLDGKGFCAYCATDANQWFNFIFRTTTTTDRPESGDSDTDIKSIEIDVSNVRNASDLVKAIVDQAKPILTGNDPHFNHHMRVAADIEAGILTLYDERKYSVNNGGYVYQQKGAKITDGIRDNVMLIKKNLYVRNIRIQDTDKSSMYINVQIPQTTLDHIFHLLPDYNKQSIFDYNVLTKSNRDALLGNTDTPGILDRGLEYLLEANTLVGAQIARLEYTESNIITDRDNMQNAESVIRDADMAKEITEYTKFNILTQSAQSMLAQANQSRSSVLRLIQ